MRYIRSENLKYKRSFSRKLIFVVPIITAFVAVIFGGIRNFQAQTIYWWYTFLLPGTVAIYCSLSEKKEKSVRYHTFYTLSIDLENAWYRGHVFSREQIYERVFGFYGESADNTIVVHVKNIRVKLSEAGVNPIQTVWGIGYKWE